jgi:CMP-N-acetylneuraminic acid synthetase
MKYLGFVIARKGSKGILNKNMRLLNEKPLIQYTFEACKNTKLLSEIHLSTDDEKIIELSNNYGIKSFYIRPDILATDESSVTDVIIYHLNWLEFNGYEIPENIVLLQPTSPIRSRDMIDNCIISFEKSGNQSLIAVSHCLQHPYEMFQINSGKIDFINKTPKRRQEYPNYYFITGSLYIVSTTFLKNNNRIFDENTSIYLVSYEESVDIDNENDLTLAEYYLKNKL